LKRIVELELWSGLLDARVPFDGKSIAEECRAFAGLPHDVVLGLGFLPDATDIANLAISIARGEVTMQAFQTFCATNNLAPDRNDSISAGRFIAYTFGQPLAWLHFPEIADGMRMAKQVLAWASSRGFFVKVAQGEAPLSESQLEQYWKS